MVCENCTGSHEGTYGSGRFCSQKCARSSSTKNNRAEINAKVSAKLKGRKVGDSGFKKGYDPRRKQPKFKCADCGWKSVVGKNESQSYNAHRLHCQGKFHAATTEESREKQGWNRGLTKDTDARVASHATANLLPDDVVLTADSPHNKAAKKRAKERLPDVCAICGMGPEWNGKPLVLRIDHENGNRRDNRIENLRKVCPNCDSQLPTYCSKNKKRVKELRAQGVKL